MSFPVVSVLPVPWNHVGLMRAIWVDWPSGWFLFIDSFFCFYSKTTFKTFILACSVSLTGLTNHVVPGFLCQPMNA